MIIVRQFNLLGRAQKRVTIESLRQAKNFIWARKNEADCQWQ